MVPGCLHLRSDVQGSILIYMVSWGVVRNGFKCYIFLNPSIDYDWYNRTSAIEKELEVVRYP
jgi:hypothetical protein